MTIGAWVWLIVFLVLTIVVTAAFLLAADASNKTWKITLAIVVAICFSLSSLFIWYRNNSESGQRALKDQESNLNGGIERTVSVYDISGNLIKEYVGKFDVDTDRNSYILFDDADGRRHVIYYTTGTVIIDEN